jgi:hypothetical protein
MAADAGVWLAAAVTCGEAAASRLDDAPGVAETVVVGVGEASFDSEGPPNGAVP